MSVGLYINEVKKRYSSGISTEHSYTQIPIRTAERLAEIMAIKTRMLEKAIFQVITQGTSNKEGGIRDKEEDENATLKEQLTAFRKILIHDLSEREFADMYAQTIAYGMFAARLQEPHRETFSRQDAAFLVPKSNPFLFNLFTYIAGPQIDDRILCRNQTWFLLENGEVRKSAPRDSSFRVL
ncbi:MAG: hypothetical protein KDK90_21730 [Leptospiraceae bacterium]|nr:hypothetical protein [Leptospiraceae bacterium]